MHTNAIFGWDPTPCETICVRTQILKFSAKIFLDLIPVILSCKTTIAVWPFRAVYRPDCSRLSNAACQDPEQIHLTPPSYVEATKTTMTSSNQPAPSPSDNENPMSSSGHVGGHSQPSWATASYTAFRVSSIGRATFTGLRSKFLRAGARVLRTISAVSALISPRYSVSCQ